jgi:hypothetical protein
VIVTLDNGAGIEIGGGPGVVSMDALMEALAPHNPQAGETWLVHLHKGQITSVERKDDDEAG